MAAQMNPNPTSAKGEVSWIPSSDPHNNRPDDDKASWVKVTPGGPRLRNGGSTRKGEKVPVDEGNDILELEIDELSALLEPVGVSNCGGKSDGK